MKLKEIHLKKFKRFTDLTITAIPSSARLVVLVGPNGCGKSSVFDAFKVWQLWKGYTGLPTDQSYCNKTPVGQDGYENSNKLVDLSFMIMMVRIPIKTIRFSIFEPRIGMTLL